MRRPQKRDHVERMLRRAIKKRDQAAKLVEKWTKYLKEIDQTDAGKQQTLLWNEHPDQEAQL